MTRAPEVVDGSAGLALDHLRAICLSFQDSTERLERIEEQLNVRRQSSADGQKRTVFYGVELGQVRLTIDQLSDRVRQLEKRVSAPAGNA